MMFMYLRVGNVLLIKYKETFRFIPKTPKK